MSTIINYVPDHKASMALNNSANTAEELLSFIDFDVPYVTDTFNIETIVGVTKEGIEAAKAFYHEKSTGTPRLLANIDPKSDTSRNIRDKASDDLLDVLCGEVGVIRQLLAQNSNTSWYTLFSNEDGEISGVLSCAVKIADKFTDNMQDSTGEDLYQIDHQFIVVVNPDVVGTESFNRKLFEVSKRFDLRLKTRVEMIVKSTLNITVDRDTQLPELVCNKVNGLEDGALFHPEFAPKVFNERTGFNTVSGLLNAFMASSAKVLILYGPPGTGKTTLIRSMLAATPMDEVSADVNVLLAQGAAVVSSEHFVSALRRRDEDFVVIEDAETLIRPRSEGNTMMADLLNWVDGVAGSNTKVVITTNIREINNKTVDEALLRPGRCFAQVHLNTLTRQEAMTAREVAGLGAANLDDAENFTLADVLMRPDSNSEQTSSVLMLG